MRKKDIQPLSSTNPPVGPYVGGQLGKRDRVGAAFADGVRVLGNGRRILARVGLHGSEQFQINSDNPVDPTFQQYPEADDVRYCIRRKFTLTPGHFPRLSALVVPCGETNKYAGSTWVSAGAGGAIAGSVTYDNGVDTETGTFLKYLPVSNQLYHGENAAAGAAWAELHRVEIFMLAPDDPRNVIADLRRWCDGPVTVDLAVAFMGGVRCVDLVIQEMPWAYAREPATDDVEWMIPMLGAAQQQEPDYIPDYPIDETSGTDPAAGTQLLSDAARRQQAELGPILAEWSGWDEETQSITALDAAGVSTASATFVDLLESGVTAWDDTNPGWSVSAGGDARAFLTASHLLELRDKDACVPVRIWIWAARTAGDAFVRFVSQSYSVGEIEVTSSTYGWWSVTAHLRCGLGAEDSSVLQLLGRCSGGTLTVRHLTVEYASL